jgi:hypothetical protein
MTEEAEDIELEDEQEAAGSEDHYSYDPGEGLAVCGVAIFGVSRSRCRQLAQVLSEANGFPLVSINLREIAQRTGAGPGRSSASFLIWYSLLFDELERAYQEQTTPFIGELTPFELLAECLIAVHGLEVGPEELAQMRNLQGRAMEIVNKYFCAGVLIPAEPGDGAVFTAGDTIIRGKVFDPDMVRPVRMLPRETDDNALVRIASNFFSHCFQRLNTHARTLASC